MGAVPASRAVFLFCGGKEFLWINLYKLFIYDIPSLVYLRVLINSVL